MKCLIGLVLFALAGVVLVTPCCLPDQLTFTYSLDVKSEIKGRLSFNIASVLNGSGAIDFQTQEFSATLPANDAYMLLSLKQGFSENRKHDVCVSRTTSGEAGREWQCAIGNPNLATNEGSGTYKVHIPNLLQGEVVVRSIGDSCLPVSANVIYTENKPRSQETAIAVLTITATPGIPDRSVFDRPCEGRTINYRFNRDEFELKDPEEWIRRTLLRWSGRSDEDED